jgi:aspartyl-tRNA(Asn)/glutamyl-tRNA(Gln) amidotransferase subunit B
MSVEQSVLDGYEPTIGIECHVQLKTATKLFARVSNDAREAPPNTTVSPICFGLPGVLPYLNEGAVELAIRAGLALNATINPRSSFDRKHYFYPDLPKGYQITQYAEPIVGEGWVEFPLDEEVIRVGIERAHLEEDAGKLTHPPGADYSLVDLNRAGTPLIEIVSKPDIKSPAAAKAYARELYLLMKYAGVSDVDLYHGHMRFDVNISVAPRDSDQLGTRAEVKNLNSFRAVEKAAQYEFGRQVELLAKGEKVVQETRGWNEDKGRTFSQRSKEEAHDYRYFPEPDLPPLELARQQIKTIESSMPKLPGDYRATLNQMNFEQQVIEHLVSIPTIVGEIINIYEKVGAGHAKRIAFWLLQEQPEEESLDAGWTQTVPTGELIALSEMVENNEISSTGAKKILANLQVHGGRAVDVAESLSLIQISDKAEIGTIVDQVIADNPKAAEDVRSGEAKAVGFLVGQVMAASKGQANPKVAQELIKKRLSRQ